MLGCHDFCGHYDWTFAFLRRSIGPQAVYTLWREAISAAQQHYTDAGMAHGLRGLYETWVKTGEDEHCDWTFTLDEAGNILRWDMRQCPSKGHLIANDLYADEDYCDHCMGWMIPVLEAVGGEIAVHEHNHAGQCWGEMRLRNKPSHSLAGKQGDITADPRWGQGYLDRWEGNVHLPLLPQASPSTDSADVIRTWFASAPTLTVLGRGESARTPWAEETHHGAVIVADPTYATGDVFAGEPRAVLLGDRPDPRFLHRVAERFHTTAADQRPLLLHGFLPGPPPVNFAAFNLPRPVPILPLLVRSGLYRHEPHAPYPTTGVFALLLAAALNKPTCVAGIDFYRTHAHPDQSRTPLADWPAHHTEACDRAHVHRALARLGKQASVHPFLAERMAEEPV